MAEQQGHRNAVSLFREVGDRFNEAASRPEQARDGWTLALDILTDLRHPAAGQVRDKLKRLTAPASDDRPGRTGLPRS